MASLADVLSAAIGARARELAASAAAPPPSAARRLAARGRGRGVGAVVAVAALVTAGTWWQGADSTVAPQPSPSQPDQPPSLGESATVTLALDSIDWDPAVRGNLIACGEGVPEPATSARGFTLETTATRNGGDTAAGPTVAASLAYEGEAMTDTVIGPFEYYVVKDGLVVGTLWPFTDQGGGSAKTVTAGSPVNGGRLTLGQWGTASFAPCSEAAFSAGSVLLAAGDYEVVVVTPVRRTAESLALLDLQRTGYVVGMAGWEMWEPGSIDCREAVRQDIEFGGGRVPVQCDPVGAASVGVTVDAEAGTVTLPYQVRGGPVDLEIVLASAPIQWTLAEDVTGADLGWSETDLTAVPLDELTCDAQLNSLGWDGVSGSTAATTPAELTVPGGMEVALNTGYASPARRGTVTLGRPTNAWFITTTGSDMVLLGTASAAFTPSGSLAFDRGKDYLRTALELTDFAPCPGFDDSLSIHDTWIFLIVKAPVVVEGDDAERVTLQYVYLELGIER